MKVAAFACVYMLGAAAVFFLGAFFGANSSIAVAGAVAVLSQPRCLQDTAALGRDSVTIKRCWHAVEITVDDAP